MKIKHILTGFLLTLVISIPQLQAQSNGNLMPVRRVGLFIGCNDGGDARSRLLYASRDAENMSELMTDIGGIYPTDNFLMIDPTEREINQQLREIEQMIRSYNDIAGRVEVLFYYSGHSDEDGLMVGNSKYRYRDLRDKLNNLGADVTIAIIDSCSSGAFTRQKGGIKVSPFLIDDSNQMEGHAYLTSSSEDEVSQESDLIQGSFFTHFLMTGLRGAADLSKDGRVTLDEVYDHTYEETLYRTELTMGGAQHPSYEIQLTGTGDLVLTDINKLSSSILIEDEVAGRIFLRDSSGNMVAELEKEAGVPIVLALPPGEYGLTIKTNDTTAYTANVELEEDHQYRLSQAELSPAGMEYAYIRGDEEEEEDSDSIPFSFGLLPGMSYPSADAAPVIFQLGFISSAAAVEVMQINMLIGIVDGNMSFFQISDLGNIVGGNMEGLQSAGLFNTVGGAGKGVQLAGLFNTVEGDFLGAQAAGLFNTVEDFKGIQAAGIFNTSGDFIGVQAAGIFNTADDFRGAQLSGIFNIAADDISGFQAAGIINSADDVIGAQISGVGNIAGHVRGVQVGGVFNYSESSEGCLIGIVNISEQMDAVPLGLVNWSRNGIFDPAIWYDSNNTAYLSLRSGNEWFYVLIYTGYNLQYGMRGQENDTTSLFFGSAVGLRGHIGKFYVDGDIGVKWQLPGSDSEHIQSGEIIATVFPTFVPDMEYIEYRFIPTIRGTIGYEITPWLAIEGGIGLGLRTPGQNSETFENQNFGITWGADGEWGLYPSVFAGVRF